jgi:lipopolysaccharide transport system ATP-binding protein
VESGNLFNASFRFQMPYLPPGDYMIALACAQGTSIDHVQHHWLHDALAFKSQSSHAVGGLIGLPMQKIMINTLCSK